MDLARYIMGPVDSTSVHCHRVSASQDKAVVGYLTRVPVDETKSMSAIHYVFSVII